MVYSDLRDWIELAERQGELIHINGASSELEMSSIAEILIRDGRPKPAVVFDDIPGYQKGFRTLFGALVSPWKVAQTLCLPADNISSLRLVRDWREMVRNMRPIPPKKVASGPVMENSMVGDKVDLLKFPSPLFHELDNDKYVGTACADIQRDPDTGWVNLGTYRNMVVDRNHSAIHSVEGRHGTAITQSYLAQKRIMPIAIAIGVDPALYWSSCYSVPWGMSEYDFAGGIKGEPIEVVEGPFTGLPLPARAEIVIEGECHPGEMVEEGPFGEWHGYYANLGLHSVPEPLIRIKAIHYRNDPILTCAHMAVPPNDMSFQHAIGRSARFWNRLETMDVPGVKGVWNHEIGGGSLLVVISIEQQYAGHAQEAGVIASQAHGGIVAKYVIVVDDDIDPSNLEQVMWAVITRAQVARAFQIIQDCPSSNSDPAIPWSEKVKYKAHPKPLTAAKVVINACRPFAEKAEWYPIARVSPELRTKICTKWDSVLSKYLNR